MLCAIPGQSKIADATDPEPTPLQRHGSYLSSLLLGRIVGPSLLSLKSRKLAAVIHRIDGWKLRLPVHLRSGQEETSTL